MQRVIRFLVSTATEPTINDWTAYQTAVQTREIFKMIVWPPRDIGDVKPHHDMRHRHTRRAI